MGTRHVPRSRQLSVVNNVIGHVPAHQTLAPVLTAESGMGDRPPILHPFLVPEHFLDPGNALEQKIAACSSQTPYHHPGILKFVRA